MPERLGSKGKRSWRGGECPTVEDVRKLFEHYRDEARLFDTQAGEPRAPRRFTPGASRSATPPSHTAV